MTILISITFFILGILLRKILSCIYNINKRIIQADEILKKEKERQEFKEKYNFSDSSDENKNEQS